MFVIRKDTIGYIATQASLLAIENMALSMMPKEHLNVWCCLASVCIVFNLVLQVWSLYRVNYIYSMGMLFLVSSYVIYCGYAVLIGMNAIPSNSIIYTYYFKNIGTDAFPNAILYAINCIAGIFIGYLLIASKYEKPVIHPNAPMNLKLLRNISVVLMGVFGPVFVISTIYTVGSTLLLGTYNASAVTRKNPFVIFSYNVDGFFFAGLYLWMVYCKKTNKLKKAKVIYIIAILLCVCAFFSGIRLRMLNTIFLLVMLWINSIQRVHWKTLVKYVVGGVILFQLMAAIRMVRNVDFDISALIQAFFSMNNGLIYEVLSEFGASSLLTTLVMREGSHLNPLFYFIKELGMVLPNVAEWGGKIFVTDYQLATRYGLGEGYIPDLYVYFKEFGPLIAVLFGGWLAAVERKVRIWIQSERYTYVAMVIPGFIQIFTSVRTNMTFGLKMIVYGAIFIMILTACFQRGRIQMSSHLARSSQGSEKIPRASSRREKNI